MSWVPQPRELEMVEREERELRLRVAAAREQAREGGAPAEHHKLVRRLEAEWRKARDRLDRARHGAEADKP